MEDSTWPVLIEENLFGADDWYRECHGRSQITVGEGVRAVWSFWLSLLGQYHVATRMESDHLSTYYALAPRTKVNVGNCGEISPECSNLYR